MIVGRGVDKVNKHMVSASNDLKPQFVRIIFQVIDRFVTLTNNKLLLFSPRK